MSSEISEAPAAPVSTQAAFSSSPSTVGTGRHALALRFSGSGSEYFRIWIVNLLLTLITLTLYWPFARARRLAYFHTNTWVGEHALGFHADPWKMFRGYLLVTALGLGYWAVSYFAPLFAWLPVVVLALIWPALWRSSLIFRLRNTSWRGVRFDFAGGLGDAYRTLLPWFLPGVLLVGASTWLQATVEGGNLDDPIGTMSTYWMLTGGVVAVMLLLGPWMLARLHIYQHGGYVYAGQRSALRLSRPVWSHYKLCLQLLGVTLLLLLPLATLGLWMGAGLYGWFDVGAFDFSAALVLLMPVVVFTYLAIPLIQQPYWKARQQNLVWGHTASPLVNVQSRVRFRRLLRINLVNWLLIALTLGFFWPFAAVRNARARLEAVAVELPDDVSNWLAQAQATPAVWGDAAGDFFGVDLGL